MFFHYFFSKELEMEKSKNEQLRIQFSALQESVSRRNSSQNEAEKIETRNKNVEKHINDLEENIKSLNSLLMQERSKV